MQSSRSVSPGKMRGTRRSPRHSRSASPSQMRGTRRSPIEPKTTDELNLQAIEHPEYIRELERFLDKNDRFPTPKEMAALIADSDEYDKEEEDDMARYNIVTPYDYAHKGTTVWARKEELKQKIAKQKLESKAKGGKYTRRSKKRRY